jgi:hypothetical protein
MPHGHVLRYRHGCGEGGVDLVRHDPPGHLGQPPGEPPVAGAHLQDQVVSARVGSAYHAVQRARVMQEGLRQHPADAVALVAGSLGVLRHCRRPLPPARAGPALRGQSRGESARR